MPDELVEPGYRPEYTGDGSLGDVGSGREFGANLYALYRAGRNELPRVASVYYHLVYEVHPLSGALEALFDRPALDRHPAHQRLLTLRVEAHGVLRDTCLRMVEVGAALVEIAVAYARTDRAAAEEFGRMLEKNDEDFDDPPIQVPEPPEPAGEVDAESN